MIEAKLLKTVIERATNHALDLQKEESYWHAPLDSNSTMEAEFLLLMYFLGVSDTAKHQKIVNHILKHQLLDGSWTLYYKGPGDLSTTVECYFALMLFGVDKNLPNMLLAKKFILAKGGLPKVRVFTKIWLALFGQWPWHKIPMIPPELIHLPAWFPINIYEFASWARATIVPLTIVMVKRPLKDIPESCKINDLLPNGSKYTGTKIGGGWKAFFWLVEKALQAYEYSPWKPGRKSAINKSIEWIIEHQEADGSWAGIQPPWVYSLIALNLMGYPLEHPIMQSGIKGFDSFSIEKDATLQVQACLSPVWDTALMINALKETNLPLDHPRLSAAYNWLLNKQILVKGDWCIKAPNLAPGGWAFEFENVQYPDIDDTAEVLMALWQAPVPEAEKSRHDNAIKLGVEWLIGMQSKNGGWAAFDKDNDNYFLSKFPFFDFGEILDPPSVDVTAHVLEALGMLGYKKDHPAIKKALKFIYNDQEMNGSWFGRWGVNYIYGIATVLPALHAVGEDLTHPRVQKAVNWLLERQNTDGGFGEVCESYIDITQHGRGVSTPSQTAWALIALMSVNIYDHPGVLAGVKYLCETINSTGTWNEDEYTGCGFPGFGDGRRADINEPNSQSELAAGFMINYHLYRHCWPLMALGRYEKYLKNKSK